MRSNKPFIKASCNVSGASAISVDLLVDTGAGFPLSLEINSDSGIKVPVQHLEMQLGLGLSGIIHGSLARSDELTLGKFSFKEVVTSFPDYEDWQTGTEPINRNGSIGNFLLKRFTVVFDYDNGQLFLKPTPRIKEPFKYDRVGIDLVGGGEDFNHIIVHHVKANSPAEIAGILEDDELLEINLQSVRKLSLGVIDEILSDPNAKGVVLKLKREHEYVYLIIKMRDLI
jgi:membrane-associated protease RseP (regulator of RpoE activity)